MGLAVTPLVPFTPAAPLAAVCIIVGSVHWAAAVTIPGCELALEPAVCPIVREPGLFPPSVPLPPAFVSNGDCVLYCPPCPPLPPCPAGVAVPAEVPARPPKPPAPPDTYKVPISPCVTPSSITPVNPMLPLPPLPPSPPFFPTVPFFPLLALPAMIRQRTMSYRPQLAKWIP